MWEIIIVFCLTLSPSSPGPPWGPEGPDSPYNNTHLDVTVAHVQTNTNTHTRALLPKKTHFNSTTKELTLCPFSPGSPERPSKPRSPWRAKTSQVPYVVYRLQKHTLKLASGHSEALATQYLGSRLARHAPGTVGSRTTLWKEQRLHNCSVERVWGLEYAFWIGTTTYALDIHMLHAFLLQLTLLPGFPEGPEVPKGPRGPWNKHVFITQKCSNVRTVTMSDFDCTILMAKHFKKKFKYSIVFRNCLKKISNYSSICVLSPTFFKRCNYTILYTCIIKWIF